MDINEFVGLIDGRSLQSLQSLLSLSAAIVPNGLEMS